MRNGRHIAVLVLLGVLAAALQSACIADLPEPSLIDKLRVLGIRADPPEARPGQKVDLEALVVHPDYDTFDYAWYACFIPERGAGFLGDGTAAGASGGEGYGLDDPGDCSEIYAVDPDAAVFLGNGATASYTVAGDFFEASDALDTYYGISDLGEGAEADVAENILLNVAGVNVSVTLVVSVEGERLVSSKRINVTEDLSVAGAFALAAFGVEESNPNTNPPRPLLHIAPDAMPEDQREPPEDPAYPPGRRCFESEGLAGADMPVKVQLTRSKQIITALGIPEEPEQYPIIVGGTSADNPIGIVSDEETWFYSFFSTDGQFSIPVVKSTGDAQTSWSIPSDAADTLPIWVVVRDGRGGTDWCYSEMPIAPASSE